ncbi:hypothetical protein PHYSODRAFT_288985 [Phytophthora sojae]|uniref:RxLR effector protein n=2 Tax=Phytophthora sojae TaxID=67593 RepID=G5ABR0_PHYSP|nr:hypothetical protein PHYSODRAFT_288985 [Phytophthora sojae]AEK81028.1 Avh249 [Phytophthora sojae]AEK81029.1 Avh249 [Phytophthora sojae]AEK81030.1 Avh249 [Phytophthora sojae]EGZ06785.1 hypothetical protein PHYSODRAFT_288985 [Phytophthora sojae]|eukprot:XP_009537549.1 hypothetical protein PHYSODRAFT_288985 [Phytophthora sojae]
MNKCLTLLLLVALTLLAGSNAVSTDFQLAKVAPATVNNAVHADIGDKRSLRGLESTRVDADEERGMTELSAKFKTWIASLKTWISNSKLVQMATKQTQTLNQKRRVAKVSSLIKKGSSDTVLYQNKVTPDEYLLAKGLNPKLKFWGDLPEVWARNDGLRQWFTYAKFFEEMQRKAA